MDSNFSTAPAAQECPAVVIEEDPETLHARIKKLDSVEPQGSPLWKNKRLPMYTASIAAAIIGWSPYGNEQSVWATKLVPTPQWYKGSLTSAQNRGDNFRGWMTSRGVFQEHRACALYAKTRGVAVRHYNFCTHPTIPWLGASPDGVTDDGILVEIKTPASRIPVQGQVPDHIMPQLQIGMEVLGLEKAHLVEYVLPPHSKDSDVGYILITEVDRDRAWFRRWGAVLEESYERFEHLWKVEGVPLRSSVDEPTRPTPKPWCQKPLIRMDWECTQ
jgi:putative phage-type endonuclease